MYLWYDAINNYSLITTIECVLIVNTSKQFGTSTIVLKNLGIYQYLKEKVQTSRGIVFYS